MTLMASPTRSLTEVDPEVQAAVSAELRRQQDSLEMIASENFAPVAVMEAQGSVLTNTFAEGDPGRRYYGGCEHVDVVEQLAIDRLTCLFGPGYANVQPHPGGTILGLALAHGGHLTHRMRITFSGRLYGVVRGGSSALDVLEKGCPLDLHPRWFPVGTAYLTTVGSVAVVLWRTAAQTYRLLPRSSFADHLGRWLVDAMTEYHTPALS